MNGGIVISVGMGTVFIGLIAIVFLCVIMSRLCIKFSKKPEPLSSASNAGDDIPAVQTETIKNRQEVIAAVSAVIAEELGTSASNIRIHSFKKI